MKKLTILIIMLILLSSCKGYDWSEDESSDTDTTTGSIYPTYNEYITLLNNLEQQSVVDKSTINQVLTALGITLSYDYSYYQSGNYICYSFNWSYWSSSTYEFIYYIVVDIWITGGSLNSNMCSYYKG